MKKTLFISLLPALLSSPAFAEWHHATAPMGQYEGYFDNGTGARIEYGCIGISNAITFRISGMHVAPGKATLSVDGKTVVEKGALYASDRDETSMEIYAKGEWGQKMKDPVNAVALGLASGRSAIWTLPNGDEVPFDLTGSKPISNCKM